MCYFAHLLEEEVEEKLVKVTVDTSGIFSLTAICDNLYFSCKHCCKREKKELEGYILQWYVSLAEPVVEGVQEIRIKGEKTCLSAAEAFERISYYICFFLFFFLFLEADPCLRSVFRHLDA